jgi:hypothetical protein
MVMIACVLILLTVTFLLSEATFGFTPEVPRNKHRKPLTAIPESKHDNNRQNKEKALSTSGSTACHVDVSALVQVYDSVFSPMACNVIHALSVDHSIRGNSDTCIFLRPPFNTVPLTPLEHAIDSALSALNDPCRTVEYWSRDEYMNIDAHVDIAEQELEEDGILRCPSAAHILYLKVKEDLRSPTCVFPRKEIGWGVGNHKGGLVDLVTVPPVQGRILRFPGSAMHAVPFPADRWLMTDNEEIELRKKEEEEEEYGDHCDDHDEGDKGEEVEEVERAVLLFNTWSDNAPPPRGVKGDYATDSECHTEQLVSEWKHDYGIDAASIHCNPVSSWRQQPISTDMTAVSYEDGQARVNLMGEQNRRLHPKNTARLYVPVPEIRAALEKEATVIHFRLLEKQLN